MPPRANLKITAPAGITFSPSVGSKIACTGIGVLTNRISCLYQRNDLVIATIFPQAVASSGQVLDFTLPLVQNPPSLKRSGSFRVEASIDGGLISVSKSGVYV